MKKMSQELISIQERVVELALKVKAMARDAGTNTTDKSTPTDVDHAERTIRTDLFDLGRRLMTEYFNEVGAGDMGFRIESDGATYIRKQCSQRSSIVTIFGPVAYCQSIYYSENAGSVRPLEQMINLPERGVTYLAQDIMARLGIEETYAESQSFNKESWIHLLKIFPERCTAISLPNTIDVL